MKVEARTLDQASGANLPALPYDEWKDTQITLHMWMQVIGKIQLRLTPLVNHWWNVTFQLTSRGMGTPAMHYPGGTLEIRFDFIDHDLVFTTSQGQTRRLPLRPQTVADFYREVMSTLADLGVEVKIWSMPVEIPNPMRFEQDTVHASYDREAVDRFWHIFSWADAVLKRVQGGLHRQVQPGSFLLG